MGTTLDPFGLGTGSAVREPTINATGVTTAPVNTTLDAFNAMDDVGKQDFIAKGGLVDGLDAGKIGASGTGFGLNTGTIGAVAGLGNLALGYANYRDAKKTNELAREGAQFNLSQAKKDAAATDAYRASYGV